MNILIKSVKIIDSNSIHNGKTMDVLIKDGKINKIKKNISSNKEKVFKAKNLHISPGWFDLHVNFFDPGYEHRETLETGSDAAIKGGFTGVMTMPNTLPAIDNRSMVEYIINKQSNKILDIYPAGNLTKNQLGSELVEMYDMKNGKCLAFTDDKFSVQRNDILKIAMLYSKDFDGLIMNYPNDKSISSNGQMHEGKISTELGLKGIPPIAEEMMINRDISLCEYTKGKIHLSYISTKESISKIKKAKSTGIKVTSDVSINNLSLTDNELYNFDTRYKVLPPLRQQDDNKALIKGLKNGTIDVITSDHTPIDIENKKLEFDKALNGIIGLESMFGLIGEKLSKYLTINEIIEKISNNPRRILGLDTIKIEEGCKANITLFNPTFEWVFESKDIKSLSKNTPFLGHKMRGKALAIINNGKFMEC